MNITHLRNFLAVADYGNVTHAAEALLISQPALSTQIKALEKELGHPLFERVHRSVELTPEGRLLKERAQEILALHENTLAEFRTLEHNNGGEITIGCAETHLMRHVADAFAAYKESHPLATFTLLSGGTEQVLEKLSVGSIDIALIVEPPHLDRYNFLKIPGSDVWGAILPRNHELAHQEVITVGDLLGHELIISRQSIREDLPRWAGKHMADLKFSGYYNLAYNGAVFAQAGLGVLLSFSHLVECTEESGLAFVPLHPPLLNDSYLIWHKSRQQPAHVKQFLDILAKDR